MWLNPHWPMWYLAGVFVWRMLTPVLKRHWAAIPVTIAISLVFPMLGGAWTTYLDLNRVVGFLPFFTLGLYLTTAHLAMLKSRVAAVVGPVALVGVYVLAGHTDDWIATKWLWYAFTYDDFGATDIDGAWNRLRLIAIAVVGSWRCWRSSAAAHLVYRHGRGQPDRLPLPRVLRQGGAVPRLPVSGAPRTGEWTIWPTIAGAIALSVFLAWRPCRRGSPGSPTRSAR